MLRYILSAISVFLLLTACASVNRSPESNQGAGTTEEARIYLGSQSRFKFDGRTGKPIGSDKVPFKLKLLGNKIRVYDEGEVYHSEVSGNTFQIIGIKRELNFSEGIQCDLSIDFSGRFEDIHVIGRSRATASCNSGKLQFEVEGNFDATKLPKGARMDWSKMPKEWEWVEDCWQD